LGSEIKSCKITNNSTVTGSIVATGNGGGIAGSIENTTLKNCSCIIQKKITDQNVY